MGMVVELLGQGRGAGRLDRAAAQACIADRLEALGRPADLLTSEAVDALIAYADGSLGRLSAALTSTLFLAATDEEARIGPETVERAVREMAPTEAEAGEEAESESGFVLHPEPEEGGFPRAQYRGGSGRLLAAGVGALAATAVMVVVWAVMTPRLDAGRPQAVAAATAGSQAPPGVSAPSGPAGQATAQLPAPRVPAPALGPPVTVGNPPLPPSARPVGAGSPAAPSALPVAPAASIVLMFRAHDPEAMFKLGEATQLLRTAGYTRIYSWPLRSRTKPGAAVRYFYAEDSEAARAVQVTLSILSAPAGPELDTQLVPQSHVRRPHPPGTIEVLIP